ncbi:hypothetical protein BGZ76_002883 [Entomortierella beljakovae]|nr:hypothetical protein BGZ76_002883 [Entomortierella beljakovae]
MKRSNDYAQSHDAFKKPRVAQGYNSSNSNSSYTGLSGSSADMYGGYGSNPMAMYNQMSGSNQYGNQYGADPSMSLSTPYQQYQTPTFGAAYGNIPFQVSFPTNAGTGAPGGRTVYIGNVAPETQIDEVLSLVRTGLVESARLLPEKNCAFISFVDATAAAAFHLEANTRKFNLAGRDLRVGWGKPSQVSAPILQAVQQGATRNVFLGNVDDTVTEQTLRSDFAQFGTIDTVKILREKNIAFVHFTNIGSAMKAVAALPHDTRYAGRRINYGKDRCAKNASGVSGGMSGSFAFGGTGYSQYGSSMPMGFGSGFDRFSGGGRMGAASGLVGGAPMGASAGALTAEGNRTVYLGNIGEDTTCEELCNVIRGGILNSIRYLPQKHIAFVTFVDPQAASSFFNIASQGITVRSRTLKVGWGQNAHALPLQVIEAVQKGATRNVYLGMIDETFTEERLRHDFAEFGEIELVNILREKNCGFVNFTNILAAVKGVEGIRRNPAYDQVKVNFGKDRCGNSPRIQRGNYNRSNGGNSHGSDNGGESGQAETGDEPAVKIEDTASDLKAFEEDDEMFQVGA